MFFYSAATFLHSKMKCYAMLIKIEIINILKVSCKKLNLLKHTLKSIKAFTSNLGISIINLYFHFCLCYGDFVFRPNETCPCEF